MQLLENWVLAKVPLTCFLSYSEITVPKQRHGESKFTRMSSFLTGRVCPSVRNGGGGRSAEDLQASGRDS